MKDFFQKNLVRWLSQYSEGEKPPFLLKSHPFESTSFNETLSQENFKKKTSSGFYFVYSENPTKEALDWFSSLSLDGIDVIYAYGVGLGYYYDAAKEWLREDPHRDLIFFEDDSEIMRIFLGTGKCAELLDDPQVCLRFLGAKHEPILDLAELNLFHSSKFVFTSLKSYSVHKSEECRHYHAAISFLVSMNDKLFFETLNYGLPFMRNFLLNFLQTPQSYFANNLWGKFKGVPAIICGAGPSLDKNIDVLSSLYDKALIFAGGSALNALNGKGVMPHFGVGIDPNPHQITRLIMNQAFELPFLYRCRMFPAALEMVHGERLYISGSGGYEIASFMEKKLGVEDLELEEGFNVLNFSLMIAHAMGCNPIICVGVDLAYSGGNSYAAGVSHHPIHTREEHFQTKIIDDELITKKDVNGLPVYTLWKWVAESMWYTHFSSEYADILLINATEGGIGFQNVVNMTLKDVKEQFLSKQYDLKSWIAGEIQNSQIPQTFTEEAIRNIYVALLESIMRCGNDYQGLWQLLNEDTEEIQESIDRAEEKEQLIFKEDAYISLLNKFNKEWLNLHQREFHKLELRKKRQADSHYLLEKKALYKEKYIFLRNACLIHSGILYGILEEKKLFPESYQHLFEEREKNKETEEKEPSFVQLNENENETYHFDKIEFKIKDPELNLDYEEKNSQMDGAEEDKIKSYPLFYPSGKLKFEQWYRNGVLHGPSTFYTEKGDILVQTWFVDGKREGKTRTYYSNGSLHSSQLFRNGVKVGVHQYFYADHTLKTLLPYQNGKLNGEVSLYHPSGKLSRKIAFVEGKKEGIESLWNDEGTLSIEAHYLADLPFGFTRIWHQNGILAKEILYDEHAKKVSENIWNDLGEKIEVGVKQGDYFDQLNKETETITHSLDEMVKKIAEITPIVSQKVQKDHSSFYTPQDQAKFPSDFSSEFEKLQQEMARLQSIDHQIQSHLAKESHDSKEALWKSPSSRKEIEKHFKEIQQEMNDNVSKIQGGIKQMLDFLNQNQNQKPIEGQNLDEKTSEEEQK